MNTKRIGMFGGTFDPIHLSHTKIAEAAMSQLNLDEVWLLVDKVPYKKPNATHYEHRIAMVELAIKNKLNIMIDPTRQMTSADSYGYNSLINIKQSLPEVTFTLIAGVDVISSFHTWKERDSLMKEVKFAVAPRSGWDVSTINSMLEKLGESSKFFKYQLIDVPPSDVSSSSSRKHTDLQDLDKTVRDYIKRNNLYLGGSSFLDSYKSMRVE